MLKLLSTGIPSTLSVMSPVGLVQRPIFCPLEFQVILAVFPSTLFNCSATAVNLVSPANVVIPAISKPPAVTSIPPAVMLTPASKVPIPASTLRPPAVTCNPRPAVTITPV